MRVHIHTDSPFFSGSENMIATLLCDESLVREFDVVLSYRSSPSYDTGLAERLSGTAAELRPLVLLDVPARTDHLSEPARTAAKAVSHATFAKRRYLRRNRRRLAALFSETRPDIVHVNSGGYPGAYSTLAAVLAARDSGVEHVIYVANNLATPYTWRRALERGLDARVAASVDVFVTGSRFAGETLSALLGLDADRFRAIPNGIRSREIVEPADVVRTRVRAPAGRPVVAVVANLERRKGHVYLLAALSRLKARGAEPLPWVAVEGIGPEEGALRAAVAEEGLGGDVAFLGREEHVFDLMSAADIVVLPSVADEDFPNVILEAMSLGKPVVASRIAGTPEQVVEGVTGLLVEPGNAEELACALSEYASDADRRAAAGLAAKQRFEGLYTAARAVAEYRALYNELASARPRR